MTVNENHRRSKKPPQEPTNTITIDCNIEMLGIRRTILKISPHFLKRNEEFRASKKVKIKENLENYLLDEKVIRNLIQQLDKKEPEEEGMDKVWENIKYYGYQPVIDWRNGMRYRIIWFHDDDRRPELIGVLTVYPYE